MLGLWLTLAALGGHGSNPASAHAQSAEAIAEASAATAEDARGRPIDEVLRVVIKSPCFDRDSLADEVEEWLGRGHVDGRISSIQVRASQGILSFSIEVNGQAPSAREFPELPRDCVEMRGAIGLSLALAIDALESDLAPVEVHDDAVFSVGAQALVTTGIPSALGLGGQIDVQWRPSRWLGIKVGIFGIVSATEQDLDQDSFRYRVRWWSGRGDLCARGPLGSHWELAGCTGFQWGQLTTLAGGRFEGKVTHGWYAVSGGIELALAGNGPLGLTLAVEAVVPLRDLRVVVAGEEPGEIVAQREFPRVIGAVRLGPTLSF